MKRVIIVGGGAAGISAALSAASKGHEVRLLESLNRLGGRLGSFKDEQAGQSFDYGEHLILGGYTETLKLLQMMNCEDAVSIQPRLSIPFYHPSIKNQKFSLPDLNPPLNFLSGIMKNGMLSLSERLKLIGQLQRLTADKLPQGITASEWLGDTSKSLLELFWKPVIISVMNCLPEEADMRIVKTAFEKGFLLKGGLGFFMRPQSEIFDVKAGLALETAGVTVQTGKRAVNLFLNNDVAEAIELSGGENIKGDYFIFTLPPGNLLKIAGMDSVLRSENIIFRYSNICNIHLAFEKRLFSDDFGCLLGVLPQWFFKRRWNDGDSEGIGYSLTISAADKLITPGADILKQCLADLQRVGADMEGNRLLYSKVVMSKEATVIISPETSQKRPGCSTRLKNVFIAGDWTDTGLPPTIESAVLSGFRAADMLDR